MLPEWRSTVACRRLLPTQKLFHILPLIKTCNFIISTRLFLLQGVRYLHSSALKFHGHLTSKCCVIDSRFVLKITDYGVSGIMEKCKAVKIFEVRGNVSSLSLLLIIGTLYFCTIIALGSPGLQILFLSSLCKHRLCSMSDAWAVLLPFCWNPVLTDNMQLWVQCFLVHIAFAGMHSESVFLNTKQYAIT